MIFFSKKLLLSNGKNWNFRPITGNWKSVVKDANKYIAVGDTSYYTMSTTGAGWTTPAKIISDTAYNLKTIAYNLLGVKYVVAGEGLIAAGTSFPDLEYINTSLGYDWKDTVFAVGKIAVVGQSNGGLATASTTPPTGSTISWSITTNSFGTLTTPQCVTYADLSLYTGLFVAAGESGKVSTSAYGTNWSNAIQIDSNIDWKDAIHDGNKFILLGLNTGDDKSYISTSTDGTNWTSPVNIGQHDQISIAYGNGTYITCGMGGHLCTSTDLINWTSLETEIITNWKCIIAGNDRFVMVGDNYAAYKEF